METRSGKSPSTFENFSNLTEELLKAWNSQENPPKVYPGGRRLHHGTVGVGVTVAGCVSLLTSILSEDEKTKAATGELSQALFGIGLTLMNDDIHDMPEWFRFERWEDFSNNTTDSPEQPHYSEYA